MGCKSMYSSCCLCFIKSTQVFTICVKANLSVLHQVGLLHNLKSCDDISCCTLLLCDICIRRLNIFNKLYLGCSNNKLGQQRMQDHPSPTEESPPTPLEHIPSNNCDCENCRKKFSGLPLLAQVVENIQQKTPLTLKQKILKGLKEKNESSSDFTSITKPDTSTIIFSSPTTTGSTSTTTTTSSVSTVIFPSPTTTTTSTVILPASTITTTSTIILPSSTSSTSSFTSFSPLPGTSSLPSTSKSSKIMNCEHCGKSFTHRGDLNKHLRSHTGEQPYVCPVCNRRFTHTSNLSRHLRVHSGDRPFHCDRCNRDFSRKDKLIMHQKTKLCMKSSRK